MTIYGLGCTGRSGGKAVSSGLNTISSVHFSCLHALISLAQTLYLKNEFDSFILLFGTYHVQNRQAVS